MSRHNDTVSASEVGQWIYCHRAWWLSRQGATNQNVKPLARGEKAHQRHSRQVASASLMSYLARILMIIAIIAIILIGVHFFYVTFK